MLKLSSRDDTGAVLVLIASSLLFMMGLAAIVIDGGLGFSERRQAQSGADFGTLAAVQFSGFEGVFDEFAGMCPSSMTPLQRATCRGAIEAKLVVDGNLGYEIPWTEWAACTDSEAFSVISVVNFGSGNTPIPCISFSSTTQDGRVKVPILNVATTFGRVLGTTSLNVSAFAEVHGSLPETSRVLPFGIPTTAGIFECLKASPHPNWGVCGSGGDTGKYGYLDIPTYGNPDMGTTFSNCTTPNSTLLSNMIRGVDHPLGTHSTGTKTATNPGLRDGNVASTNSINVCPIFGSNANEINVQTGVVQSIFEQGMTYGYGASERGPMWGSLFWKNGNPGNPEVHLDDTPIWTYLNRHDFCPGGAAPTTTQEMIDCLGNWTPGIGVIFDPAIATNNRYNFAPRFWTDFTAAGWYLILRLEPIYVNTSYWGCNASGSCDGIHAPGDAPTPVTACTPPPTPYTGSEPADQTCYSSLPLHLSTNLNAVTSFNLDRGMLPASALDPFTADGPLINLALTR